MIRLLFGLGSAFVRTLRRSARYKYDESAPAGERVRKGRGVGYETRKTDRSRARLRVHACKKEKKVEPDKKKIKQIL